MNTFASVAIMALSVAVRLLVMLLITACLLPIAVSAQVRHLTEDFTSNYYCDPEFTIAEWDTVAGEIRLPSFQLFAVGGLSVPGLTRQVLLAGDVAWLCNLGQGFLAVDIRDPSNPTPLASCPGTSTIEISRSSSPVSSPANPISMVMPRRFSSSHRSVFVPVSASINAVFP